MVFQHNRNYVRFSSRNVIIFLLLIRSRDCNNMDFKWEKKSSVPQLNFDKPENALETNMWTIPSLNEEYLRELMRKFPKLLKNIMEKDIIPFIVDNKRIEKDDASIIVIGPNNQTWKLISGHGKCQIYFELTNNEDPVITIKADDNEPEEMYGQELTKTFLGKCIIQKCGNEGSTRNESMRRLLQVAIDRLHRYDKSILQNAKVYIYDSMETLILVSGKGKNYFVINSENGNLTFKCTKIDKGKKQSNIKLCWEDIRGLGIQLLKCSACTAVVVTLWGVNQLLVGKSSK